MITPEALRDKCLRQIELAGEGTVIVLTIPGHASSDTARLLGAQGGPRGRVYGPAGEGRMIVGFKARTVLDWIKKNEQRIVVPEAPAGVGGGAGGG